MARWSGVVWLWWATVAWLVARVTRAMGSSSWCRVRLVWLGVLLVTRMGSNAGRHRGTWPRMWSSRRWWTGRQRLVEQLLNNCSTSRCCLRAWVV